MKRAAPTDIRDRLEGLLGDGIACAQGLRDALAAEREALENRDIDRLTDVVRAKDDRIRRLADLETGRVRTLNEAGFGATADDMEAAAAWCSGDEQIVVRWRRLRQIAAECDALNLTNGAIIRLRQQQVGDGLALLRGGQQNADTYGPAGVTPPGVSGRALTEA